MATPLHHAGVVHLGLLLSLAAFWPTFAVAAFGQRSQLTLPQPASYSVNDVFAEKLRVYDGSLSNPRTKLEDTLRYLYTDLLAAKQRLDVDIPELEGRTNTISEADRLFSDFTLMGREAGRMSVEAQLSRLLEIVTGFNPLKYARIRTAYPVMRRAVAAYIAHMYVRGHRFTTAESALVAQISERLHKLHRLGAQSKRITEFFHVSKSGGTTLCQLGELNGCATESFTTKRNCLISYFRDLPRWTAPGAIPGLAAQGKEPWCAKWGREKPRLWTCKRRRELLTKIRWTFYANEHIMHDHNKTWNKVHPCREFNNVMVFREPRERVESHMQNVIKEYQRHYNGTFLQHFNPANATQWRQLAVPVVDNYYVRSMLGNDVYNRPLGSIGRDHLEVAKMVALQFEVLLTLKDKELNQDLFHLGMGWSHDLTDLHARKAELYYTPKMSDDVRRMVDSNVMDIELYEFALRLQVLDAIVFGVVQHSSQASFWTEAGNPRLRMCGYIGAFRTMLLDAKAAAAAAQIALSNSTVSETGEESGSGSGTSKEGRKLKLAVISAGGHAGGKAHVGVAASAKQRQMQQTPALAAKQGIGRVASEGIASDREGQPHGLAIGSKAGASAARMR